MPDHREDCRNRHCTGCGQDSELAAAKREVELMTNVADELKRQLDEAKQKIEDLENQLFEAESS